MSRKTEVRRRYRKEKLQKMGVKIEARAQPSPMSLELEKWIMDNQPSLLSTEYREQLSEKYPEATLAKGGGET
jgi:hypothetical protein